MTGDIRCPTVIAGVAIACAASVSRLRKSDALSASRTAAPVAAAIVFFGIAPSASASVPTMIWSGPQAVDSSAPQGDQGQPGVWTDTDGSLHVVWIDGRHGAGGDVYYARLGPGASQWDRGIRITREEAAAPSASPVVAVDSIGNVHAVWVAYDRGDPDVWHCVVPVHGAVCSAPQRVSDDAARAAQLEPAIAADPWGSVHAVWTDYREGRAQLYYSRRTYRGSWSPNVAAQPRAGSQSRPSLAATRFGDLYLAWEESAGERVALYASRLPPGGDVWWPSHELAASDGERVPRSPALAADSSGTMHAVWIEDGATTQLRLASLRPEDAAWGVSVVAYHSTRGRISRAALAGGPGSAVVAVWTEGRPDGARLFGGAVASDVVQPAWIDWSPSVSGAREPVALLDAIGRAHALWVGRTADGRSRLVHAWAGVGSAAYPGVRYEGWLQYRWAEWNCRADGFAVVACDGTSSPLIRPDGADLLPLVGSYVAVDAAKNEDTCCVHARAHSVTPRPSACPRDTGAVTGTVLDAGEPAMWASVYVGPWLAPTGDSGRFFLDGIEPNRYPITVTARCALVAALEKVPVVAGQVTRVEPAAVVRGEVVEDCRVDVRDMVRVTAQYKSRGPFSPPCADQDDDGAVTLADIVTVAANIGRRCPTPWSGPEADGGVAARLERPGPIAVDGRTRGHGELPAAGVWRGPSAVGAVVVAGAQRLYAWELEISSPLCAPADTDSRTPGTQPVDADVMPDGTWVIANRFDAARGSVELAASLTGSASTRDGDVTIGRIAWSAACDRGARVLSFQVLDRDGRTAAGKPRIGAAARSFGISLPIGWR